MEYPIIPFLSLRGARQIFYFFPCFDRLLRNHAVACASNFVHPIGQPIIHSVKLGESRFPACSPITSPRLLLPLSFRLSLSQTARTVDRSFFNFSFPFVPPLPGRQGVGNNPDSFP